MKSKFLLLLLVLISCSNVKEENKLKTQTPSANCINYDSTLLQFANTFDPKKVNLSKAISPKLDTFLLSLDTTCLRKQSNYEIFISVILLKLYLSHLRCCNQEFDLASMKKSGPSIIINEYQKLSGTAGKHVEFLNSRFIEDYVLKDETLKNNVLIRPLLNDISKEHQRINKGDL